MDVFNSISLKIFFLEDTIPESLLVLSGRDSSTGDYLADATVYGPYGNVCSNHDIHDIPVPIFKAELVTVKGRSLFLLGGKTNSNQCKSKKGT